ncbi:hypothetical protein [Treponema sp.]|uniref:tetratricopeptide repeat protein n=1 Tax=Treponema sp. TaxID=166 RepID=UPI00298DBE32|nr:hypothetical protein [Treponema sp.]MCR5614437.1 hypothetical protein [Treponema sp.]
MKIKIMTFFFCAALASLGFAQTRPVVTDINAIPQENSKIKINWTVPENSSPAITNIIIYRDTKQISTYEQLASLKPVAKLASDVKTYIDSVSDSREYFYTIIASTENGEYILILPSINTTVYGVRSSKYSSKGTEAVIQEDDARVLPSVKQPQNPSDKIREVPLPAPGIMKTEKSNSKIFGEKALSASKTLGKKYVGKKNKITKMHVFEEDLICPEGGDEYFLFRILKDSFVKKDFAKAVTDLNDFLSVRRDEKVAKRATFYLGESYYFSKNYEKALFNFLNVKGEYPELSKKWIDSSLDMIEIK